MKRLKKAALLITALIIVSFFSACDTYSYVTPSTDATYTNPDWAPPYSSGVRYYYLPDIETYYDLSNREFVYLDDGQWLYSQSLPSQYDDYDLSSGFVVALNNTTYQPWMHYHYYVSHYPRYYYRDYYDHSNIPNVRGFNENNKSAIYWSENDRRRARSWDNQNISTNRQFRYSRPDRQQQNSNIYDNSTRNNRSSGMDNDARPNGNYNGQLNRGDNNVTPPRSTGIENGSRQPSAVNTPQNTHYYGRSIGQPVRVEKQMRQRTPASTPANTERRNAGDSRVPNGSDRK